ncbi:hypothetical protein [Natroniella sp. ANB-PHB2]|uniref:hypothetical protein n=1 Tax=Natroniella sp. ANB-PHB2 TaxID=3384444 RepID=UPI0038D43BBF
MSAPVIPDRGQEEALTDLLVSIALEETALAHFMNAEAEKIQAVAQMMEEGEMTPEEVLDFQRSVSKVMRTPIKKEMLLQFKLEDVLDFLEEIPPEPPIEVQSNTVTASGIYEGVTYTDTATVYYHVILEEENNNEEVNTQ